MNYSLFISSAKGLEYLLEAELRALGLQVTHVSPQGVFGNANLHTLYQICLWTRLANRIQLLLFSGVAQKEQGLYQLCHQFHWQTVFYADKTFAIEFHGTSKEIRNTMFGAQLVKDAVVDHFRQLSGKRPTVDPKHPQIRLHAHLKNDQLTVSFDLTGYSLHQRGYRLQKGEAPLKETLAAAILLRANWPELAAKGYALYDPFCGSGTLLIEGAMMAANIAPGLLRHDQSLIHWVNHEPSLWEKMRAHALQEVKPSSIPILGSDAKPKLIQMANNNAERAGVHPMVKFIVQDMEKGEPIAQHGLVVCNPPYGERQGEIKELSSLYQKLGKTLHAHFQGWQVALFTSNPDLAKSTGLRSHKQYTLFNGPIACKLYCMDLNALNRLK